MKRLINTIIQQGVDACRNLEVEARDKDFTLLAKGKLSDVYPLAQASRVTFVVPGEARFSIDTETNSDLQFLASEALRRLQDIARREDRAAEPRTLGKETKEAELPIPDVGPQ